MRSISGPRDCSLPGCASKNSWQGSDSDVRQAFLDTTDHRPAEYREDACYSSDFGKFLRRRKLQPKASVGIRLAHVVVNDGFRHENAEGDTGDDQTSHNRLLRMNESNAGFYRDYHFFRDGINCEQGLDS